MSIKDFLDLALDNTYRIVIYDFAKSKEIFDSDDIDNIPNEIWELDLCSWELGDNKIILNIDSNIE